MNAWKRAAFVGFVIGVLIAVVLIVVAKLSSHGHAKLWAQTADASSVLFPTYVFLLPVADRESFPHDLLFYGAAVIGNGIVYSLAAQIVIGLFLFAKRIVGHFP